MRRRVVLLVAILSMGWAAGACTRCDVDCAAPARLEEVVAQVRSTDPGIVHVRTESGDTLDIRVFGGPVEDLERGTRYRFPLMYLADEPPLLPDPAIEIPAAEPVAFFPDDCDCTAQYISDLDGEVVDPGIDIPFGRYALSFIALSMLGALAWALARWQRGVPL